MAKPTINVVCIEAPQTSPDLYVVEGDFDPTDLDVTVTETSAATVQVICFDTYPATTWCTEPDEYTDFCDTAERLAGLLEADHPVAASALRAAAARFRELWQHAS